MLCSQTVPTHGLLPPSRCRSRGWGGVPTHGLLPPSRCPWLSVPGPWPGPLPSRAAASRCTPLPRSSRSPTYASPSLRRTPLPRSSRSLALPPAGAVDARAAVAPGGGRLRAGAAGRGGAPLHAAAHVPDDAGPGGKGATRMVRKWGRGWGNATSLA